MGEISSYPRGYKENGGIFCHNHPWISIANAEINNNDEAFNVYKRTCPAYTEEYSEIHRTEPYVYCQMVAGPEAPTRARARTAGSPAPRHGPSWTSPSICSACSPHSTA